MTVAQMMMDDEFDVDRVVEQKVSMRHFRSAILACKPTVATEALERFKKFTTLKCLELSVEVLWGGEELEHERALALYQVGPLLLDCHLVCSMEHSQDAASK